MALFRTSVEYLNAGTSAVNVLYFDNGAGGGGAAALCEKIRDDWFTGVWKPAVGSNTFLTKIVAVEVVRMGSQDAAELGVSIAGSEVSGSEAPQLAVCVQVRTGEYGRTRRGRFFQTGIPDNHVVAGKLDGAGLTNMTTAIAALTAKFIGESATSGFRLGVFSRERYKIISNPFDDYWKPATSVSAQTVLSTMRSRKPGA